MKKIIIPGKPIPLRRHRHTKSGHNYNSQRSSMNEVSFIVKSQWNKKPYSCPLRLLINFFMPIPKKDKNKLDGLPHSKRSDLSNLLKFYEDSLNLVLWDDDSLIYEIHTSKIYSIEPRTEIEIIPLQ